MRSALESPFCIILADALSLRTDPICLEQLEKAKSHVFVLFHLHLKLLSGSYPYPLWALLQLLLDRLVTLVLIVDDLAQCIDRDFKVLVLFPQHFNHLNANIILLFKSLLLYLFFQIRDAFEESLDLASLHLLERLDFGGRSRVTLLVLVDLLHRGLYLELQLLSLPLKHHDHFIFLIFEHLS